MTQRLPELREAVLDAAMLDELVRDLAALTSVHEVLLRGAPQELSSRAQRDVLELPPLLATGQIRAAQVRYRYDDKDWCDTLLATDAGVRLVRMCMDSTEGGDP